MNIGPDVARCLGGAGSSLPIRAQLGRRSRQGALGVRRTAPSQSRLRPAQHDSNQSRDGKGAVSGHVGELLKWHTELAACAVLWFTRSTR